MTTCGYDVVMKKVRIAELKARLSENLRAVRRGETVTVMDRDTPVARLVPIRKRKALSIVEPHPGATPFHKVKLPPPLTSSIDVVDILLELRQNHR
jgi:prevent-host-death family protein